MKRKILPILISLVMVTSVGSLCFADESSDTTAPEQTESVADETQATENTEATTAVPEETTPAETVPAETTVADASTSVNTESEYAFKTPFTVTVLKDNTAIFSDATCTTYRLVMAGEKLTVTGSDGTYFKLDSGEYIVNFALEYAEDASFEKAPTETEAPSESTTVSTAETSFSPSGIDMYEEPEETGNGEIKAKEDKETDPRFTIFCVACGLGLALGALGGFFAGGWWNKRKMNAEHDEVYKSIKYGETKEALDKEKEMIAKERAEERAVKKAESKKKRADFVQSIKEKKAGLAEKRAEQARQKKLEELKKLQQDLGMESQEDPDAPNFEQKKKKSRVEEDVVIPASTKKPFQLSDEEIVEKHEVEELEQTTTTYAEPEPVIEEKPQEYRKEPEPTQDVVEEKPALTMVEKPQRRKVIRPEDMEYGGKDNGGYNYYWDPNDPKDEPFRIKDGKKVFYPDENHNSFYDEDGNKVEF